MAVLDHTDEQDMVRLQETRVSEWLVMICIPSRLPSHVNTRGCGMIASRYLTIGGVPSNARG